MAHIKIYLDNCCYNRPFDDQTQLKINLETMAKLSIQKEIRDNKVDLVTSYILVAENSANRFEIKRNDIQAFIDKYTHTYVSAECSDRVKEVSKSIIETGIKLMDACHIACAIIAECDYFITTDKRLLSYKNNDIKMVNPIDYVFEMEEG